MQHTGSDRLVFLDLPVADVRASREFFTRLGATTPALLCVSAADRDAVDALADTALASGGSPAKDPMDHGVMYARSFFDVDGHHWEVMWMSPQAIDSAGAQQPVGATA